MLHCNSISIPVQLTAAEVQPDHRVRGSCWRPWCSQVDLLDEFLGLPCLPTFSNPTFTILFLLDNLLPSRRERCETATGVVSLFRCVAATTYLGDLQPCSNEWSIRILSIMNVWKVSWNTFIIKRPHRSIHGCLWKMSRGGRPADAKVTPQGCHSDNFAIGWGDAPDSCAEVAVTSAPLAQYSSCFSGQEGHSEKLLRWGQWGFGISFLCFILVELHNMSVTPNSPLDDLNSESLIELRGYSQATTKTMQPPDKGQNSLHHQRRGHRSVVL